MDSELKDHDSPEGWVVEQGLENIELVGLNDSAIDLIEQIHQDKSMENDSIHYQTISWLAVLVSELLINNVKWLWEENEFAKVNKDKKHQELIDDCSENVSPHFW